MNGSRVEVNEASSDHKWRYRLFPIVLLGAWLPAAIPLCHWLDSSPSSASKETAISIAVTLLVSLFPSLPGLLGTSFARRRSDMAFAIWFLTTLTVQLVVIGIYYNAYSEVIRWKPFGLELSAYPVEILYVGAIALDVAGMLWRKRSVAPIVEASARGEH